MSEKIQPSHLARTAYVYVRQSSLTQVRHNRESQRRQYGLAERARQLGFRDVCVIDDDLGRSGSGSTERPGFARLLVCVCEGRAGAVVAIEASRLARNNREWHHLVDLCGLTDTLVIDDDGVYSPRNINDRLLLGLKGTMSEFELSLFRQRANEALRQMVQRGEVLRQVPVGYQRTERNGCEKTPNVQVQETIHGVFAKFHELGSLRQTYLWYLHEQLRLPVRRGEEIAWETPTYARLHALLKNPIYAGAFVSGRHSTTTVLVEGQARKRVGTTVPMEKWAVLIRDHHESYITWDEFTRNQALLRENSSWGGMTRGAAKQGTALLTGLLRCRRCSRRLIVKYCGSTTGRTVRYECRTHQYGDAPKCIGFQAVQVERRVVEEVLRALRPIGVEAALEAQANLAAGGDEKRRALALAVEKASYDVQYARRQYDAVDPDNRLVAAELEKRWNDAIEQLHQAQLQLEATPTHQGPSAQECDRLRQLGDDLERMWNDPDASMALKKRILRTALVEVLVDVNDEPREIVLSLHWTGGVHTSLRVRRRGIGQHLKTTPETVLQLITDLAKICNDAEIAATLNRLGLRSARGRSWKRALVASLRGIHEIPVYHETNSKPWVSRKQAMRELGIGYKAIDSLIRKGVLPARQIFPQAPWVIERTSLVLPQVQRAIDLMRRGRAFPCSPAAQTALPFKSET